MTTTDELKTAAAAPVSTEAAQATEDADAAAPETDASVEGGEEEQEEEPFFNPEWKWYVVHTYSGYENRAKDLLMDRVRSEGLDEAFGQVLIPTESVVELKKGAKRTTTRKFFPGYIMVEMELTDETWHLVKNTAKITGFVGGNSRRPRPMRDVEVRRLTQQMEEGTAKPKAKQTFEEGQQVRIIDGAFTNFTGSVEEVRPDKQKLKVLVSIFGRATPVELDFMQVESV